MVVGGGSSAGQAAVFLAGRKRRVYLLIRGDDLGKSIPRYLVDRVMEARNVELLAKTPRLENSWERTVWKGSWSRTTARARAGPWGRGGCSTSSGRKPTQAGSKEPLNSMSAASSLRGGS